ncbi:MurR/RpiR family transcriptional regulator [Chelativorans salis]|uniref:MurR/RpiR family transcriptional regulator n=1 Tax=Chelativorans salis TaxID=2978478 RepID=A0ABT2LT92_9HYPH|nr:MurR/RpiR family transcriptional regulator [Chelativorans sp. EGI FJ00035]MCT7376843.1 MurR/RpiR family transcriptional regulator [Chelativorans sp. EGI FJ00035]
MKQGPLAELLLERFDSMPPQLQMASRFVLDHPDDVALMSMREQANRAGVSHSTMMRLARSLGLNSYEEMRALYARGLREAHRNFEVPGLSEGEDAEQGGFSLVGRMSDTLAAQVARFGDYGAARQLMAAADVLAGGRRLFCLGLRSEHAVAHHFNQTLSLFDEQATLLDAVGGTGIDNLGQGGSGDVMLAVGVEPYTRATVEIARQAAAFDIAVVAITDSQVSPLARIARQSIIVTTHSLVGFQSLVSAMAAAEILAALVAARRGIDVEQALQEAKARLSALDVYWSS